MSNSPRIVLVTNQDPHHLFWCEELMKDLDVVGVFFPQVKSKKQSLPQIIKKKKLLMYGWTWFFLKVFSLGYNKLGKSSFTKDLSRKEKSYFGNKRIEDLGNSAICHKVPSINSPEAIKVLQELQPDYICFLGGDIAKKEAIDCAKVATLNYHSGLSPIYNGTKTVFHAVSDYRPNLAGGTLMYMNERIDGGRILSHYLPEIKEDDKAADLFLKGIKGAAKVYKSFFQYVTENDIQPEGVKQQRSVKFVRNVDWTIVNDIKLKTLDRTGIMKRYTRNDHLLEHFDLKADQMDESVRRLMKATLSK